MSTSQVTHPDPTESDALGATMAATRTGDEPIPRTRTGVEPLQGQAIGRYVVLERIGAGAMGVVLAAYDPELDRKVALKLLHPRERSHRAHDGHLRLLAEAQALARLSDPNVVAVHDVGTHEGQVFVAMEFVEGQTLGRWLAQQRHPWSEVLDVMIRAGRGLAAAHARELVHRDFKPDNVMIGDDGRVRVMDFGLARADPDLTTSSTGTTGSTSTASLEASQPRQRALELQLTNQGAMVGTPAYMAPEQLSGSRGGPAADQFSYCVSSWEALFGQRPFVGDTLPELLAHVLDGEIAAPPAGSGVPRWLRRVVERGLAVEPERRWPSMQALLHALQRGRARARRTRGIVTGALVVAAGVGLWGVQRYDQLRGERACATEAASIEQVWNDDAAAAMREAMTSTGMSHASATMDKVRPWLDAQAHAWQAARTEACTRAEVHETWDAETSERARWCLDDRRMELEAVIAELTRGDARAVTRAVPAVSSLAPVAPCTDAQLLARMPIGPAEQHEEVRAVRAELWQAHVLRQLGEYAEGITVAREALERAEALAWPPLTAAARTRLGELLDEDARFEEAEQLLEEAYFQAARSDAFDVAAQAASKLVSTLGYNLSRYDDARRWSRHCELMLAHLPDDGGLLRARHLLTLSTVDYSEGAYDRATTLAEEALRIYEQMLAPDHPRVADALTNLGIFVHAQGDYPRAREHYERALRIREDELGPDHPQVADALSNLGSVLHSQGVYEQAKVLFERALAIRERALGLEHPDLARALNNLASIHHTLGEYEAAKPLFERALYLAEQGLGPNHPRTAANLGNLADVLRMLGELDRARELFERALQAQEAALGPDHPDLAYPLQGLSSIARAQGRIDDAVALASRAVRVREAGGIGSDLVAEARLQLAKAQWDQGHDRTAALAQAKRALKEYREIGEAKAEQIAEIQAWLAEHPDPSLHAQGQVAEADAPR